jgi:hypothetical protein
LFGSNTGRFVPHVVPGAGFRNSSNEVHDTGLVIGASVYPPPLEPALLELPPVEAPVEPPPLDGGRVPPPLLDPAVLLPPLEPCPPRPVSVAPILFPVFCAPPKTSSLPGMVIGGEVVDVCAKAAFGTRPNARMNRAKPVPWHTPPRPPTVAPE